MAEFLNDAVSRLPPQFLTGDVLPMYKENVPAALQKNVLKNTELNFKPSLVFPTEFPYEFDSLDSVLSSPLDSVLGSTETETTSDEENFLAGLTRRLTPSTRKLKKGWVVSGSPESTLSGLGSMSVSSNGSPNGSASLVSSPPTTPFADQNDTWDLISAAASQIARLRMSDSIETAPIYTTNSHERGLFAPPKSTSSVHVIKDPNLGFYTSQSVNFDLAENPNQYCQYVKQQEQMLRAHSRQELIRAKWASSQPQQIQNKASNFGYENARCGQQLTQSAWPHLQVVQHQQKPQQQERPRPVFVAGSGSVKRERAGTGVFLPRRYGNNNNNYPHDYRRKSGAPNVLVPHVQQRLHGSFGPNYDVMIARRNALITLQKRSLRAEAARNHHEMHLPKEWTY